MDCYCRCGTGMIGNDANADVEDGANGREAALFQCGHRMRSLAGPALAPSPTDGASSSVEGFGSNQPIVRFVLFKRAAAASLTCCRLTLSIRAASEGTSRQLAIVSK